MRMGDDDMPSLEYIEDPYFPKLSHTATPSFDELGIHDEYTEFDTRSVNNEGTEWSPETEFYLRTMPLDEIFCIVDDQDLQRVEAELSPINNSAKNRKTESFLKRFLTKKAMHDVRVTFIDFSKPYLAKISSSDNYKQFLNIGSSGKLNY